MLVFDGEGFKALGHGFMLLLLLLGEGKTRGDAGGGGAVTCSGPHRRLQHLHGVAPLGGRRDVHLVQGRAGIGHRVGVGGVLPRCFGRPCFSFAVLVIIAEVMERGGRQSAHLWLTTAVFSPLFNRCYKVWPREHGEQAVAVG